jgi:outer membrane biosynthesis protein TonB
MAEQETKVEEQEVKQLPAQPATKAKAKAKPKAKAKAKPKTAKKPKAKAKAKAPKKAKRPAKDNARKVAAAMDGELNTDQVRQLRALAQAKGKELTRGDLKEAVGIGRDGKYSQQWLDALWELARKRPPLIVIGNYEGDRKAYHSITAAGRKALEKAEAAAKKVAKENAA